MKTATAAALLVLLAGSALAGGADVTRYEIDVTVLPDKLEVRATLHLAPGAAKTLELELADTMKILEMDAGSPKATFRHERWKLLVDRKGAPDAAPIRFRLEGAPRMQFSRRRGGFLRTSVGPDITYVRSQYPFYPRAADDAAEYAIDVNARADWIVHTAGNAAKPKKRGDRRLWGFRADRPVRNVGLIAGPYALREAKVGGDFLLDALVLPGHEEGADRLLATAKSAFDHYAARFGKVEMDRFTLVEMPKPFGPGSGYGEDGYVLIGEGAFAGSGWADSLVAHEVAHTWWGREVSFRNFASESLACYATLGWLEAEKGEAAARATRRNAVRAVIAAADGGREVALASIREFGAGMDPRTYHVHAYDKGMMILSMVADALGREKLDAALAKFLEKNRGGLVGWPELRKAIATGTAEGIVAAWEVPGIPTLSVSVPAKRSRRKQVSIELTGMGATARYRIGVPVLAGAGEKAERTTVELDGPRSIDVIDLDAAPGEVRLDPDWRLLLRAPRGE